jgi:hypothetical protein
LQFCLTAQTEFAICDYAIDTYQLWRAIHRDGRYLLVTHDFSLAPWRG